jgi:hypothetical protein
MRLVDAITKKMKGKQNPGEPGTPKRVVRLVENVSGVIQVIGKQTVRPGGRIVLDVAPGSQGASLLERGVFAEVGRGGKSRIRGLPNEPASEEAPPLQVGCYKCPWCDNPSNERSVGRDHILSAHAGELVTALLASGDLKVTSNVAES